MEPFKLTGSSIAPVLPCASHCFPILNIFIEYRSSYYVHEILSTCFHYRKTMWGTPYQALSCTAFRSVISSLQLDILPTHHFLDLDFFPKSITTSTLRPNLILGLYRIQLNILPDTGYSANLNSKSDFYTFVVTIWIFQLKVHWGCDWPTGLGEVREGLIK